jgi:GntR family transcriptional regulator
VSVTVEFFKKPLYLQVRDAVAQLVLNERWKPGTPLPNETDLSREFGVSAGTMRKALDLLESEHLLTRQQGRGTFVADQSSAELAIRFSNVRAPDGTRISGEISTSSILEGKATEKEAFRLELGQGDTVYRIRRVRTYAGRPYMLEQATVPAALFPDLPSRRDASHRMVMIARDYRILLGAAQERVSAAPASTEAGKVLGIRPGTPITVLDRLVRTADSVPVEWRVSECHLGDLQYMADMN